MKIQEDGKLLNAEFKTCTKCKRTLPATTFYFHVKNATKSGLQARCKECRGASFGETRKKHPSQTLETLEIVDGKVLCRHCDRWLPLTGEYFFKHKSPIGFELKCKECKGYEFGIHQGKVELKTLDGVEFRKCTACDEFKENTSDNFRLMSIEENRLNPKCKKCEYAVVLSNGNYKIRNKRFQLSEKGKVYRRMYKKTTKGRFLNRLSEQRRRARKNELLHTLTPNEWHETLLNWTDENGNVHCAYCDEITLNPDQEHIIPVSKGGNYAKDNIIPVGGTSECACNQKKSNMDLDEYYLQNESLTEEMYLKVKNFVADNSDDSLLMSN